MPRFVPVIPRADRRAHPTAIVGLVAVVALVGSLLVAWLVSRSDADDRTTAAPVHASTTTLRPCLLMPYVTRPEGGAPDGTYPVTIMKTSGNEPVVNLGLDDGGAGYYFAAVAVSPGVHLVGSGRDRWTAAPDPSPQRVLDAIERVGYRTAAVTVVDGTVTSIDLGRRQWDITRRASDPCQPGPGRCMSVGEHRSFPCTEPPN
jgi:hypothetical protein